jgi:ribosomal protein S18 acetylase RimI-like enzyme
MSYEAATWRGGSNPPTEELLARPEVARYLESWGRRGDVGLVAEDDEGCPLGAAWFRLMRGYGFVDERTPELTVAVEPHARGRGVGTALLRALIDRAEAAGFPALSLSVEEDNPAIRLYERLGFVPVAKTGNAWTMVGRTSL